MLFGALVGAGIGGPVGFATASKIGLCVLGSIGSLSGILVFYNVC